ncbi:MAG TPA: phosphopentomutase [Bdellovibrionota bacterium]|jgi:phosphopentomutase
MGSAAAYDRVFFLVLDSVGIGAMPDAADFGDTGAHTLGHIADAVGGLKLPHLGRMGLGNISSIKGISPAKKTSAAYGKSLELAKGKDTTTGHWEMAGVRVNRPFPTYYDGFPQEFVDRFVRETGMPGYLGNIPASGTEIIQKLGDEHMKSGKPIVYTSADSVFQIACHEESFGLDRLYKICEVARNLCDELGVARVIARPFLGSNGNYKRTTNRKDYSVALPEDTMMDRLQRMPGMETVSIGKVASIYSERGFSKKVKAGDNRTIFTAFKEEAGRRFRGLAFANLVDFDMLYGHRRDSQGYARELEWLDAELPSFLAKLGDRDLLLMTADHGNDPTFHGTDHTREYVPVLAWSKQTEIAGGRDLGTLKTFADLGQTVLDALGCREQQAIGSSFLSRMTE